MALARTIAKYKKFQKNTNLNGLYAEKFIF